MRGNVSSVPPRHGCRCPAPRGPRAPPPPATRKSRRNASLPRVRERKSKNPDVNMEGSDTKPEMTKTWGFRRSTIARREFMEEVGELSQEMLPTRRTLRQPKGRNRAKGRQATPPPPGLPPKRAVKVSKCGPEKVQSCTDPWQTSDEADNIADSNTDEMRNVPVTKQSSTEEKQSSRTDPVSEGAVSAEDSDELTLKELSEQLKKRQQEGKKRLSGLEGCEKANELKNNNEDTGETTGREEEAAGSVNKQAAVKPQAKTVSLQLISKAIRDFMPAKRDQKTATGRMSARRIEDTEEEETTCDESSGKYDSEGCDPDALYCICRQKHNKRFMICCDRCQEWFHGDCVGITEKRGRMMEKNGEDYVCPNCSPCASPAPPQTQPTNSALLPSTSPSEEKHGEDKSIKGKIRKASGFGQKRKMKIIEAATTAVTTAVEVEESSLPKCIGPGCSNDALQDSVYCGHQCILQHAAQAMRSLTDAKQPKPAVKAQAKLATHSAPKGQKRCLPGTLSQNRATESPLEGHTEDEEAGDMQAVQLQSDHNHEGVRAQQTAFDSSVFYKPTTKDKHHTESNTNTDAQDTSATFLGKSLSRKRQSPPLPANRKPDSGLLPAKSKKSELCSSHSDSTALRHNTAGALEANRIYSSVPAKPPVTITSPSPSTSTPATVGRFPQGPQAPLVPSRAQQPQVNSQIRQNIRRSLTDILCQRVEASDDLEMSQSDIGKLAVNIETELYNMFLSTDSKYKNKYRSLMFNLKDPKNKVLFYKVIKGEITPFKLTRLSQQELQARDTVMQKISESPVVLETPRESPLKAMGSNSVAQEECTPISKKEIKNSLEESKKKQPPPSVSNSVPDVISCMLKDTTSEHKTHLFDLKCRICTGQISADEEDPEVKRPRNEDDKLEPETYSTGDNVDQSLVINTPVSNLAIMESPASPIAEDCQNSAMESPDFAPIVIPSISTVSSGRQDPRTTGYRPLVRPKDTPAVIPSTPTISVLGEPVSQGKKEVPSPAPAAPPTIPKSILMNPSRSSATSFYSSSVASSRPSRPHLDNDTSHFLARQETIWKGFLNMQTVAKFVTKGYLVSGTSEYLKDDIPDTIHIGGRILPQTVWEYVERLKTSPLKDLCLIRFHAATDEEEVAYVSLFSYFNSCRRFGVVSNSCNHIKDFYLIPLSAQESVPSILLPLEGPGLEENRPNLLLGLAICQKPKRPGAFLQEVDEKRPKIQVIPDPHNDGLPASPVVAEVIVNQNKSHFYDPEIRISKTPPGSPQSIRSSSSSSSDSPSNLTGILSIIKPGAPVNNTSGNSAHLSATTNTTTPLQTILKTLFGKAKSDSDNTKDTTEHKYPTDNVALTTSAPAIDPIVQQYTQLGRQKQDTDVLKHPTEHNSSTVLTTSTQMVDPIVQQYQQNPKNVLTATTDIINDERPYDPEEEYEPDNCMVFRQPATSIDREHEEDDRPYDPEEYDPATGYYSGKSVSPSQTVEATLELVASREVAYDPEDDTFFEEMQSDLGNEVKSIEKESDAGESTTLSQQQKMLEELNKQIEEQKRQLAEQEEMLRLQRVAVGVSMAHFSVSDALMSPPGKSFVAHCNTQFSMESEMQMDTPMINQSRDPRQRRDSNNQILDTPSFQDSKPPHMSEPPHKSPQTDVLSPEDSLKDQEKKSSHEEMNFSEPTQETGSDNMQLKEDLRSRRNLKSSGRNECPKLLNQHHKVGHHSHYASEKVLVLRQASRASAERESVLSRRQQDSSEDMEGIHSEQMSQRMPGNVRREEHEEFQHVSRKRWRGEQPNIKNPREFIPDPGIGPNFLHTADQKGPPAHNQFEHLGSVGNVIQREPSKQEYLHAPRGPPHHFHRPFSSSQCDDPPFYHTSAEGPASYVCRPPRGHFASRGPRPHIEGPRGPSPQQFQRPRGAGPRMALLETPRGLRDNSEFVNQGCFNEGGENRGVCFGQSNTSVPPRTPLPHNQRFSSSQYRGSLQTHRGGIHMPINNQGHSPGHLADNETLTNAWFENPNAPSIVRPFRRGGSLLPTPMERPIGMFSPRMQHPLVNPGDSWQQQNSPARRCSYIREDPEFQDTYNYDEQNEEYHREFHESPHLQGEQHRDVSEYRREEDGGHGRHRGQKQNWDRGPMMEREVGHSKGRSSRRTEGDLRRGMVRDRGIARNPDKRDSERERTRNEDWHRNLNRDAERNDLAKNPAARPRNRVGVHRRHQERNRKRDRRRYRERDQRQKAERGKDLRRATESGELIDSKPQSSKQE